MGIRSILPSILSMLACLFIVVYLMLAISDSALFGHRLVVTLSAIVLCSGLVAASPFVSRTYIIVPLFTIGLFVALYFQASNLAVLPVVRVGMPLPRIVAIEGRVVVDATISQKGNGVCTLALRGCTGKEGSWTSANGNVMVVGPRCSLLQGDDITLIGKLSELEDGSLLFLYEEYSFNTRRTALQKLRKEGIEWVLGRIGAADNAKVLACMLLLGRCEDPSFPLRELSRSSGCAHLLALSGMHLQFFVSSMAILGRYLLGKRKAKLFAIPLLAVFLFLAGIKPSLIRSAGMFLCSLLVLVNYRLECSVVASFVLTFLLQIFLFPDTIPTAGCLFSYAALGGILSMGPMSTHVLSKLLPCRLASLLGVAIVAVLWSAPCSLLLFGTWSVVGILISPLAGLVILCYMGLSVCCLFPLLGQYVHPVMQWLYHLLEQMLQWASDIVVLEGRAGYLWFLLGVLTATLAIEYADRAIGIRSKKRHELELCIRFPSGDH